MHNLSEPLIRPRHSESGLFHQLRRKCLRAELQFHLWYWFKWVTVLLLILYVLSFSCWSRWMESNMKTILIWNGKMPKGRRMFGKYLPCNCVITKDRGYRRHVIDAIVFNGDKPYTLTGLDEVKTSEEYLGVYTATKPFNELLPPPTYDNVAPYNLTMTYRTDSDVPLGRYFVSLNDTVRPCTKFRKPNDNYMNDMTWNERTKLTQMLAIKSRIAVYTIFPVNHRTKSKSALMMKLRQHLDLDAYENCNTNTDCMPYKFLLVFDTEQCKDYINPDFFAALGKYIVPVVFNGTDYSRHAPPLSYIKAEDFESMGELAYHLKRMSADDASYQRFFWWRAYYSISGPTEPYCALCQILNDQSKLHRNHNDEAFFMKWWFKSNCS